MAIIKCKMCGGDLNLIESASTAECEFCGSVQTVPKVDNEKKLTLFARANRLRGACDFDKAAGIYEAIVADFPEEAEAYWGLVLCQYGIEYVDDPATGKKIPTCHRSGFDSVMKDSNVEMAQEYADVPARRIYREEAKVIEELRKSIVAVSANEEPYDVFICYKETDFDGKRTLDSVLAQDIYDALTDKGYRVFFSRISLEDKLGTEYEPYIFAALNSAKIMLVVGTDFEFFNAVWVKNEWSRFLKLMAQDKQKHLIPCYKGIDAYDMPEEFARLQAQDLDKMGAIQDIVRGVQRLLPKQEQTTKETVVVQQTVAPSNPTVDAYLKRANLALEDGEWTQADGFAEQALNIDPENVQAYLVKLLAEMKVAKTDQLAKVAAFSENNKNYKKLMRFAHDTQKKTFEKIFAGKREDEYRKEKARIRARHDAAEAEFKKNATVKDGVLMEYRGEETEVYIPYSITAIEEFAFSQNELITSVIIPDSVTSIGHLAFGYCNSLAAVTIPASVTQIDENPFCDCARNLEIIVDKESKDYCVINGHLVDLRTKKLIVGNANNPIPSDGSISVIGDEAFMNCEFLSSITIPDGVTTIGCEAFGYCNYLTTVSIPASVTQIEENPFIYCAKNLKFVVDKKNKAYCVIDGHLVDMRTKTLIVGNPNMPIPTNGSVTAIGENAFHGCEKMRSVTIPDCVTQIGENAFFYCTSLSSVTIPNGVTDIGYDAFAYCNSLTAVTIPASVTQIEGNPFRNCDQNPKIILDQGNKDYRMINGHLVDMRTKTLIVGNPNMPIPTNGSVTVIGEHAFDGCNSLNSVTVPQGITGIGESAFSECVALTRITIPDSVTDIGENAFFCCFDFTIFTPPKSYAWKWARVNGIKVQEDEQTKQARIAADQAKREEVMRQRREAGLCQICGGEIKGLLIKKCVSCGCRKDY